MDQQVYSNCKHHNSDCHCHCNKFFLQMAIMFVALLALIALLISIIFSTTEIEGAQIQLQNDTLIIEDNAPIIFNTVLTDNSSDISYNTMTGEITITSSGTYYINWWFSADGSPVNIPIDLSIVTSTGEVITASSPILSDQITGNALLEITASPVTPVTLQLVNTTGNQIFVGATSVKADLTIINVSI